MGRGSKKKARVDGARDEEQVDAEQIDGDNDIHEAQEASDATANASAAPGDADDDEVIELSEIDVLRADIERALEERATFEEKYKHALADMSNMRRRASEDAVRARQQAVGRVTQEILPVLDAFDLALSSDGDREALLEGVRMVYAMLEDLLGRNGVTAIQAEDCSFDPTMHEAIGTEERSDVPPGQIVAVHQAGYKMQERVLRPARVVVASAPADSDGDVEDSDATDGGAEAAGEDSAAEDKGEN